MSSEKCLICFELLKNDTTTEYTTSCSHTYHLSCIQAWCDGNDHCPYCRAKIRVPSLRMAIEDDDPEMLALFKPQDSIHEIWITMPVEENQDEDGSDYDDGQYTLIGAAIKWKALKVLQVLLDVWKQELPEYVLEAAVRAGCVESLKLVLQGKSIPKDKPHYLLHKAAEHGHLEMVEFLLNGGLSVNSFLPCGDTPLHLASYKGHLDVVKLLIRRGAKVNVENNEGLTPLYNSMATEAAWDIFNFLLESGAKVTADQHLMHRAADRGHLEIVRVLFTKGVKVNSKDRNKVTPFHMAACDGNVEMLKLMLQSGADINIKDGSNFTPLLYAASYDQVDAIYYLAKECGAKMTIKTESGNLPLAHAVAKGNIRSVAALLACGAPVDAANDAGETALLLATGLGSEEIVKMLLSHGANVNTHDTNARTPLHKAAWHNHVEIARMLLEKGANVHAKDVIGKTPLSNAAGQGNLAIAQMLLAKGADVHTRGCEDETPLHWATGNNKIILVRCLVEAGADVNALKCDPHATDALSRCPGIPGGCAVLGGAWSQGQHPRSRRSHTSARSRNDWATRRSPLLGTARWGCEPTRS